MEENIPKINSINESIFLTITINIVIATAINYFMDPNIFTEKLPKVMATFYSVSIVGLILCYVILQLIENYHSTDLYSSIHKVLNRYQFFLLINLLLSGFILVLVGEPKSVDQFFSFLVPFFGETSISLNMITTFITFNIIIPYLYIIIIFLVILFKGNLKLSNELYGFIQIVHTIRKSTFSSKKIDIENENANKESNLKNN